MVSGVGGVEIHPSAGAIAVEAVGDVHVLLEVVAQREVEERPLAGGQLHRGGQAALDHREVARREVAVEVVHVGDDLEALGLRQRLRVDARAGDHDHAQLRHPALGLLERRR